MSVVANAPSASDLDALLNLDAPFEKRLELSDVRVPKLVRMFGDVIWRTAIEPASKPIIADVAVVEHPGTGWTRRWKRPKPTERHRFALVHRPFESLTNTNTHKNTNTKHD